VWSMSVVVLAATFHASLLVPSARTALSAEAIHSIDRGGIHIEPQWIPPRLVAALRADAKDLFAQGLFSPDGLTNTAVSKTKQGFTARDRQTFRGDGWRSSVGNVAARLQFADAMYELRQELATGLRRPSLGTEGVRKHEMTYNWYEPGAKLGRHLDEHHEETKGPKGWRMPTRRSVTWLVCALSRRLTSPCRRTIRLPCLTALDSPLHSLPSLVAGNAHADAVRVARSCGRCRLVGCMPAVRAGIGTSSAALDSHPRPAGT